MFNCFLNWSSRVSMLGSNESLVMFRFFVDALMPFGRRKVFRERMKTHPRLNKITLEGKRVKEPAIISTLTKLKRPRVK